MECRVRLPRSTLNPPFVGRASERSAIEAARVSSIHGPGGAGKSRLALEIAPAFLLDCDGVVTIAELRERFAREIGNGDPAHALAARGLGLIADEVDRLDPDAISWLASFEGRVILTSRRPIEVEPRIALGGLDAEAALELFTALAGECEEARVIVDRVDRLPLAIELAAGRVALLGGRELLARLDRQLETLPALRAAIAGSWSLLDDVEKTTLIACARFDDTFDAELVEASGGDLDALGRLRDSLLVADASSEGRPRFRLAESVRAFAREHADEDSRWIQALLARARVLSAALRNGADADLAAYRADLLALGTTEALELVAPLLPPSEILWRTEGVASDRLRIDRAEALRSLGRLADARREIGAVARDAEAARVEAAILRTLGESARAIEILESVPRSGFILDALGSCLQSAGRLAEARERHAEAVAMHVANGAARAEALARSHLAVATQRMGDPARAIPLHEHALAMHRDLRLVGAEMLHLAFAKHELGGGSASLFANAKSKLAEAGAIALESMAAMLAARFALDEGDFVRASLELADARRLLSPDWPRLVATERLVAGHLAMSEGAFARALEAYDASLAASRDVEVGFELLTPAYRALAATRLGLGAEYTLPAAHENPHLRAAWEILAGRGSASNAPSSEVRRAARFAGTSAPSALRLEANRLVLPDGRVIELGKRKNVRLVLACLFEARRSSPGAVVMPDALLAAGWPGEKMRADAATKRLHTAIWTLRSLGLDRVLLTKDEGYLLDPAVPVSLDEL